ncbi:D-alanyl-D-alanine carboxypeptidase family protein [Catenulispora rubra]|uniref:D-alanyl-D-alanine carboxypeptidase family protein n=1 Tax=Catenulispora rubra TaxID=280293 RepID=UPI0018920B91|nr:D-alanyl-D-alanine carboxypeptidase family protein [Catenulispora rubra]
MEQRDHTPQEPGEDIGRAAAEAAARAGEYESGPAYGEPTGRRPKRWFVVGGVAIAALAVAGTAAALAGRSHSTSHDTTLNAASSSTPGPTPGQTSAPGTPTTDGTTGGSATSDTNTPAPTSGAKTPSTSPKTPATSPTSPSKSATSAPPPADGENGDCENTSHDTPADDAVKFSGMTHGTQQAFLTAQKAAQATGVSFVLNSGYRSAAYQQRVFDCWVKQLGSPQAARQYALPPSESAHVQGYAMDIAPPSGAAWLESTAGKYGLCRRYQDETWHFEYQSRYKTQGCPALLPHP